MGRTVCWMDVKWMDFTEYFSGQRFAMMEEKVIVANIVRNFVIKSVKKPEDMVLTGQLTLQSMDGIQVELTCV